MMLREDWKFHCSTEDLARAAQAKLSYHEERLTFWKDHKRSVMDTIRADGLELDETIAATLANRKARDWHRSAQAV